MKRLLKEWLNKNISEARESFNRAQRDGDLLAKEYWLGMLNGLTKVQTRLEQKAR